MQRLDIYNSDLDRVLSIFTWISLLWEDEYNGYGNFLLELQQTDQLGTLIRPDMFVMADDCNKPMIITSIVVENNTIVAKGHLATYLLTKRVSDTVIANTNAESAMRGLVNNMSPFVGLSLGDLKNIPDVFAAQTSDQSVFEYCRIISEYADVGFYIRKQNKTLLFECYKPGLNANAKYAVKYGNLGEISYTNSVADFYNVAIVAGMGEGDDRITVTVGDTASSSYGRAEMYVDAKDLQQEEGQSQQDYLDTLRLRGLESLAEVGAIENVEFNVDDDRSKLGDIITVLLDELGINLVARVTKLSIKSQRNTITKSITVGKPIKILRGRN